MREHRQKRRGALAAVALLIVAARAVAGDSGGSAAALGAGACSAPVCHGSVVAREAGDILRNEYTTWMAKDHHSRAYGVLLGEQSRAIAAKLGIGPAQAAPVCLDCHATAPAAGIAGNTHVVSQGVSCQGCHGDAADWLESHDDAGRTHAANVAAGMTDLADAGIRAETCASCHVGDAKRFVTHRILAAGHPRSSFELDTFSYVQPRHYRVDDDYRRRKGEPTGVVSWAVGQSVLVGAILARIAGNDGLALQGGDWPEFALFDCFGCHQPMRPPTSGNGAAARAGTLGTPAFLRASAAMLALAADVAALPADARVHATLLGLDSALGSGSGDPARLAAQALARIRRGQELFDHWKPTPAQLEELLAALCSPAAATALRSYGDAEQATMAVQAVMASLADNSPPKDARTARLKHALDGLFEATRSETGFRREDFVAALRKVDAAR